MGVTGSSCGQMIDSMKDDTWKTNTWSKEQCIKIDTWTEDENHVAKKPRGFMLYPRGFRLTLRVSVCLHLFVETRLHQMS